MTPLAHIVADVPATKFEIIKAAEDRPQFIKPFGYIA